MELDPYIDMTPVEQKRYYGLVRMAPESAYKYAGFIIDRQDECKDLPWYRSDVDGDILWIVKWKIKRIVSARNSPPPQLKKWIIE